MKLRSEVISSAIYAVEYNTKTQFLTVEFTSGREYIYPNVPFKHVKGLLRASSVGKYFNTNIKQYAAKEV